MWFKSIHDNPQIVKVRTVCSSRFFPPEIGGSLYKEEHLFLTKGKVMIKPYKRQIPVVRITAKLGDLIDCYYDIREEKRMLKQKVGELDATMKKLEEAAFAKMKKQGLQSSKADHSQGSISKKETYYVEDWDEFYAYAKRKGNEDLLAHQCSSAAVKLREEEGKKIPGVDKRVHVYLSVRKL